MVGWESIPIVYRTYSYIKNYIDLNEREKALVIEQEQLKEQKLEIAELKEIFDENTKNFSSMIDFNLHNINDIYINAGENVPSPNLEFSFFISNRSLFDFKVKKISMKIDLENFGELGEINTSDIIDLAHQQIHIDRLKLQLHPHTIIIFKSLKKESKKTLLKITLRNIKIDFEGDKEFSKPWPYGFKIEIPMDKVNVSL
ncbi:MAG: hypothetical protein WA130_07765 [Candidatus Methanoperedens sp.]